MMAEHEAFFVCSCGHLDHLIRLSFWDDDEPGARADLDRFVEMMGPGALDQPRVVEALELLHSGASSR